MFYSSAPRPATDRETHLGVFLTPPPTAIYPPLIHLRLD